VDEVDDLILVDEALQNALSIHNVTSLNGQSHGSGGPGRAPHIRRAVVIRDSLPSPVPTAPRERIGAAARALVTIPARIDEGRMRSGGPVAVNLILRRTNQRLDDDLACVTNGRCVWREQQC
jgi:hypothetical protein